MIPWLRNLIHQRNEHGDNRHFSKDLTNRKHFHSKLNNLCVHFLRAEPECLPMMEGRHMMEAHNLHMMEDSYDGTIRQQIQNKKKTVNLLNFRILLASETL